MLHKFNGLVPCQYTYQHRRSCVLFAVKKGHRVAKALLHLENGLSATHSYHRKVLSLPSSYSKSSVDFIENSCMMWCYPVFVKRKYSLSLRLNEGLGFQLIIVSEESLKSYLQRDINQSKKIVRIVSVLNHRYGNQISTICFWSNYSFHQYYMQEYCLRIEVSSCRSLSPCRR